MDETMELADYVLTIALGGAFLLGLMFIVMRREAQVNLQSGMSAEGLLQQQSGMGFGKAKKNLDRKLATIQDLLRQQNQGDRQLAEDGDTASLGGLHHACGRRDVPVGAEPAHEGALQGRRRAHRHPRHPPQLLHGCAWPLLAYRCSARSR